MLKDKVYDILKWLCIFVFPAVATFIRVVFTIWNIPYGEQISATIVAFNACLGAILGISNAMYKKNQNTTEQ